jgi:hypothetical protein
MKFNVYQYLYFLMAQSYPATMIESPTIQKVFVYAAPLGQLNLIPFWSSMFPTHKSLSNPIVATLLSDVKWVSSTLF